MTFAAERWPDLAEAGRPSGGVGAVWLLESAKLARLLRVRVTAAACVLAPFLVAASVHVQSSVPADTLFGQWLHESGFALPMVVVGFAGQWVLPLLTALVAGDIFSAEDHFGTWKTVLTRSRTRGQIFAGKAVAATTYTVALLVLLAASSMVAGLLLGTHPIVGLGGQLVPTGRAWALVSASWASQLPPVLAFGAVAVLLSIATRNSVVGIGGPVLVGLVLQLLTLVDLPTGVRAVFPTTAFGAWHGFWVPSPFLGPFRDGLVASGVWFVACGLLSWVVFRRRSVAVA